MHKDDSSSAGAAVVEFRDVTIGRVLHRFDAVHGITLQVDPGTLTLIALEEGRENTPLGHAAQGLLTPEAGRVLFKGVEWSVMDATAQAACRGQTRRVFEHYGWVTNLDLAENLCLAECHHSRRPIQDVLQEANRIAQTFGLPGVPEGRPSRTHGMLLRRLEWVRAFMGNPALIILERPLAGAPKSDAPRFLERVCEAVDRGIGVLWLTDEERVWDCPAFARARRYRLADERLSAA